MIEVELKYLIPQAFYESTLEHGVYVPKEYSTTPIDSGTWEDTYVDTEDELLFDAGFCMRIRNGLCDLKGLANRAAELLSVTHPALTARTEYESMPHDQLMADVLSIKGIKTSPICSLVQDRTHFLVSRGTIPVAVLSLDKATAGAKTWYEMEIEFNNIWERPLFPVVLEELTDPISRFHDIIPSTSSKFERALQANKRQR